jgi:cytochrome P450
MCGRRRWTRTRSAASRHRHRRQAKDQSGPGFLLDIGNPRHDQLRKIVQPHFLPRRIAAQEDGIRAVVRGLVGSWRYRGEVDLA